MKVFRLPVSDWFKIVRWPDQQSMESREVYNT